MMQIAVYARGSIDDQHREAQLAELRAYAESRSAEAVEFVEMGGSLARRCAPLIPIRR